VVSVANPIKEMQLCEVASLKLAHVSLGRIGCRVANEYNMDNGMLWQFGILPSVTRTFLYDRSIGSVCLESNLQ
jgi:hypothetical protein